MMRIANVSKHPDGCIYCGRFFHDKTRNRKWSEHPLGNPYRRVFGATTDSILANYTRYIKDLLSREGDEGEGDRVCSALDAIKETDTLGCWCVDMDDVNEILYGKLSCHCQIIWRLWSIRKNCIPQTYSLFAEVPDV